MKASAKKRSKIYFIEVVFFALFLLVNTTTFSYAAGEGAAWNNNTLARVKKFIDQIAEYTSILSEWTRYYQYFKEYKEKLFPEKVDLEIASKQGGSRMQSKKSAIEHEDKLAYSAALGENSIKTDISTGKTGGQTPDTSVLCNTITVNQGPIAMYSFAVAVADAVTQSIESLFVEPEYGGLVAMRALYELSCPDPADTWSENDPRTMNPRKNAPPECVDKDEAFIDADISARIVSGGKFVLAIPPLVEKTYIDSKGKKITVKVPIPDKSLAEKINPEGDGKEEDAYFAQRAFKAAVKYCIRAALGNREPPPHGEQLNTAEGRINVVKWSQCAARRSGIIRQCAWMIARHTRPPCDQGTESICGDSMLACSAAIALGADLSFDCRFPMTLDQAEEAAVKSCSGLDKAVSEASAGAKQGEGPEQTGICMTKYSAWMTEKEKEKKGFAKVIAAAETLNGCESLGPVSSKLTQNGTERFFIPAGFSAENAGASEDK